MSYSVNCIELDAPRSGRYGIVPEVCGGFSVGPFTTFEEATSKLEDLLNRNDHLDGIVVENETFSRLTYLHGSYVF